MTANPVSHQNDAGGASCVRTTQYLENLVFVVRFVLAGSEINFLIRAPAGDQV